MITTDTAVKGTTGDKLSLTNRILLYFYLNPSAKDTLEGIAQWWMNEPVAKVKKVLEVLVDLQIVRKADSGGATLYMIGEKPLDCFVEKLVGSGRDQ